MERMPSFEFRSDRSAERKRVTFLESNFGLDTEAFERTSNLRVDELTRLSYDPFTSRFIPVLERTPRQNTEVLLSRGSNTLIVPPPTPGKPVTMAELAAMTLPVADFINAKQPDIVVGCDRGARIYAFAVYSMWSATNAPGSFPSLDRKMRYSRLSTSLPLEVIQNALKHIISSSAAEARRNGESINGERFSIMFIDDWVASGATRKHILQAIKDLGLEEAVDVSFVVMCGEGGDATGSRQRVHVPWHDDPNTVGVNYDLRGAGFAVLTPQSRAIRKEVRKEVRKVARALAGR